MLGKLGVVLNLSPEKVLLLLVVALVVLGPSRLPGAARSFGRLVANLRRMSAGVQSEMRDALAEPRDVLQGAVGDLGLDSVRKSLTDVINPLSDTIKPLSDTIKPLSSPPSPPAAPEPPAAGEPVAAAQPVTAPLPPPPDDPALN